MIQVHHGLIEIRLQLVTQLGVAQQVIDFVGIGSLNRRHGDDSSVKGRESDLNNADEAKSHVVESDFRPRKRAEPAAQRRQNIGLKSRI